MCRKVSVFCSSTFLSMHASWQHTRAHTCRDHSYTLKLRWWQVWRWFALAPQRIIHTNIRTLCRRVCAYLYICCLFLIQSYIPTCILVWCVFICSFFCLFFCAYLTAGCLSLFFSSIQAAFFGEYWDTVLERKCWFSIITRHVFACVFSVACMCVCVFVSWCAPADKQTH